jgi:hypothetical protein
VVGLTWDPLWRSPLTRTNTKIYVWSYYDGWPTQMKDGLIITGDLPKCKMVSLWWVTYPSGEKGRVVSFLWVTYPGKKQDGEWSHSNGWPTQKMVSLWWVTYPGGKEEEWSHSYGWPTQGEEWPHYNGWPTQVKKNGEWSHSNGWPTQVERVTYPSGKGEEWSHSYGWPTQGKNGLIIMGDLPR